MGIKISELPLGTANANAIVPATNAAGTLTEKIKLSDIVNLKKDWEVASFSANSFTATSGRNYYLPPTDSIEASGFDIVDPASSLNGEWYFFWNQSMQPVRVGGVLIPKNQIVARYCEQAGPGAGTWHTVRVNGNPFDQNLNAADSPQFKNLTVDCTLGDGAGGGFLRSWHGSNDIGTTITSGGVTFPDDTIQTTAAINLFEAGDGIGSIQPIGGNNQASANYSVIGGGTNNTANGENSTISGGWNNVIDGERSFIGGGLGNYAAGRSVVCGGLLNGAAGGSAITGGRQNSASSYGSVCGGAGNTASGYYSSVLGGLGNAASGNYSVVGGGRRNTANYFGTVGGGRYNTASGFHSTVGGGSNNTAGGNYSTVGGGFNNTSSGDRSAIAGGFNNTSSGSGSTVGGGSNNTAGGFHSTVGGGAYNTASGGYSSVLGGNNNKTSGSYSSVLGGQNNDTNSKINAHIIGSNITADAADTTFVNNLKLVGTGAGVTFADGSVQTSAATAGDPSLFANGSGVRKFLLRNRTNKLATPVNLLLDDNTEIAIPELCSWYYTIKVVAKSSEGIETAIFKFEGAVERNNLVTLLLGDTTSTYKDNENWNVNVEIFNDDTLRIQANGQVGTDVYFVAYVEVVQAIVNPSVPSYSGG